MTQCKCHDVCKISLWSDVPILNYKHSKFWSNFKLGAAGKVVGFTTKEYKNLHLAMQNNVDLVFLEYSRPALKKLMFSDIKGL